MLVSITVATSLTVSIIVDVDVIARGVLVIKTSDVMVITGRVSVIF